MAWLVASVSVLHLVPAVAGPAWTFDGKCNAKSYVKAGRIEQDIEKLPRVEFRCNRIVVERPPNTQGWFFLVENDNDRTSGPTGFLATSSGFVNLRGNFEIPLARTFPSASVGTKANPSLPAKGICALDIPDVYNAREFRCISVSDDGGSRFIVHVDFDITKVTNRGTQD